MALALLPFDPASIELRLPRDLRCVQFTGHGEPPDAAEVDFYVPAPRAIPRLAEHLAMMPHLSVLQLQSAGVDHVLRLVPSGVALHNSRGVHDVATSELAVALILASLRDLAEHVIAQSAGVWRTRTPAGRTLAGRTVLIVGYGSIGGALATRLAAFSCTVVPVARTARAGVHATSDLPELLGDADVVVLLAPLTDETYRLVDADFLSRMRDGALLVNVARGGLVDTDALTLELETGRLRAALDVTDPEPLPEGHALWRAPGLLLTPHVGVRTDDAGNRLRVFIGEQLQRFAGGLPLVNEVARDPQD